MTSSIAVTPQTNLYFLDQVQQKRESEFISLLSGKMIEMADEIGSSSDLSGLQGLGRKKEIVKMFDEKLRGMALLSRNMSCSDDLTMELERKAKKIKDVGDEVLAQADFAKVEKTIRDSAKKMEDNKKNYLLSKEQEKEITEDYIIKPRDLKKIFEKKEKINTEESTEDDLSLCELIALTNRFYETQEIKQAEEELDELKKDFARIQTQIDEHYKTKREHIHSKKGKPTKGWQIRLDLLKENQRKISNKIGEKYSLLSALKKERIALDRNVD